ncbi:poly(A) RNA polymerase GLD2-B-like [Dermacentor variabilis]|uniref:poly(A) RNA polymerase GLD2-B-like n=1 Tax=Dermacentor variabilis TaxID=34621 RepID=UPI003F5C6DF8
MVLANVADMLKESGFCTASSVNIVRARVPLLELTHTTGIPVDVTVNSAAAVDSSRYLKHYSKLDKRVAPLVLFIKRWAHKCGIRGAREGGVSSVTLCVMAIAHLQDMTPTAYGSTVNGFGEKKADLDITLLFEKNKVKIDSGKVLSKVADMLTQTGFCTAASVNIIPARVPLLELTHTSGVPVDVTVNSSTAVDSTHYLKYYSNLDESVAPLVLFVKHWADKCGIRGAREGGVSSVTLCVMVIAHLQGTNPRVLPRLSPEMTNKTTSRNRLTWRSRNQEEVGELFQGFIKYFAAYDFRRSIVSITPSQTKDRAKIQANASKLTTREYYVVVLDAVTGCNLATAMASRENFRRLTRAFRHESHNLSE